MASGGILAGRLALVTGGGSGIGRAVCQLFAKEGASVAVVDLNQKNAQETVDTLQGAGHAFTADVSSSSSIADLMSNIKDHFPALVPTIAVNSAGITKDGFLLKMDEKKFDDVLNVNLKGTFLVTQAVCRRIIENNLKPGAIVNISSVAGKFGNIGQCNYGSSKAGVEGFTRTAANELAGYGIRVNTVVPGFITTPMTDAVPDKVIEKMKTMIPLGRVGKPEELAEACLFLASDRSSYVTGACLQVSGGLAM